MKICDVQVVGKPLVLAKAREVSDLESRWWFKFPDGYQDYVTKLGDGILGGTLVRIYPPWRIETELTEWRRRIGKYWFWDQGRRLLPKERTLECIILGDTLNGDELVFHPARPAKLFVLPHDSESVYIAGSDLLSAVDWMCSSGKLVEPFSERDFEPYDSRKILAEREARPEKIVDPEGESLDELVELARRWIERHAVKKLVRQDLKQYGGKDKNITLRHEGIVTEGDYPWRSGYYAVYRIEDRRTGLEVGVFRWHKDVDSRSVQFEPNERNLAKLRRSKRKR